LSPKPRKPLNPGDDSAAGPAAGFIFQFQKALVLLADLQNVKDYISIEQVDDVAAHKDDSTVIITAQAKHSIASSGTTFEDTSYSLWRTIQVWIMKLVTNTFTDQTTFVCTTNKKIPNDALLRQFKGAKTFDDAKGIIEAIHTTQQGKFARWTKKDSAKGKSMSQIINLIEYALSRPAEIKIIWENLNIEDEANFKDSFLNRIHAITPAITPQRRDRIYEEFYGWIIHTSLAKWKNAVDATITKESFNNKFHIINSAPSIINAIFRTKSALGTIDDRDIKNKQSELFVRQIEDMDWREDVKNRKVKTAILEFIYHDIELKHVIDKGDYTQLDFDAFLAECERTWQEIFDSHFALDLDAYTTAERNEIARTVYTSIMQNVTLAFNGGYTFTTDNAYMRNGCFLKLSNIPTIGWHPEWEQKYK